MNGLSNLMTIQLERFTQTLLSDYNAEKDLV